MRKKLTDIGIKNLKHEEKSYEVMDTEVPKFGVRVMASKSKVKSYISRQRFPKEDGSWGEPVRRSIGQVGDISLADAREVARRWNALVRKGIDPAVELERQHLAALEAEKRSRANSFGAVLDAYVGRKPFQRLRSAAFIERDLRREWRHFADRPITEITSSDIKRTITKIVERSTSNAHVQFAFARTFWNWVVTSEDYGVEVSPMAKLKAMDLIGERSVRDRYLQDHEIASYWHAAEAMEYPWGPLFRLLMLSALRLKSAAGARWSEFDAEVWVVPASRMKGREGKALPFAVPLVPKMVELFDELQSRRFQGGDYVFTCRGGLQPIKGFARVKKRLDQLMMADLGAKFEPFTLHDLRRAIRTRCSALPDVQDVTCEALLAHVQPKLHQVYNVYDYLAEKRHALELWHKKLMEIVTPPPANLLRFPEDRRLAAVS
jgi:integrase